MKQRSSSERFGLRSLIAAGALVVFFAVAAINLARIMLIEGDEYKAKARANQLSDTEILPARGSIYDINGVTLAKSVAVWNVVLYPDNVPDDDGVRRFVAQSLSTAFGADYNEILDELVKNKKYEITIKKDLEYEEKEKAVTLMESTVTYKREKKDKKGNVTTVDEEFVLSEAVSLADDSKRYYPEGSLASCVIGFQGSDGNGKAGVEYSYDDILTGSPGRSINAKNSRGDLMVEDYESYYAAEDGSSLILTLDGDIQSYLEKQLWDVYESSKGAGAYGVIMNVNTGAVLAMASIPNYDPNNPYGLFDFQKEELEKITDEDRKSRAKSDFYYKNWRNFNVSDTYEPGSVFKTITASAALDEGVADESFTYTCIGYANVADTTMKCHNHSGHGYQNFKEGLMNSCNPFFITLGQKLGAEKLYSYIDAFGFTSKTGIDLPAEFVPKAGNNYYALEDMGIVQLSSIAFGQSINITPIQMCTAISAIANGGNLVTPYVVDSVVDSDGNTVSKTQPKIKRQVISEETSKTMTDWMVSVVEDGTGRNAYVEGYSVAGKTGTSQKKNQSGHYVASFGCFAPSYDPEIAVIIIVDEPIGAINGGQICTPVAARVVEHTLEKLDVERRYTDGEKENLDRRTPDMVGKKTDDAVEELENEGYTVKVVGSGDVVVSQNPGYNSLIMKDGVIVLYTESSAPRVKVTVPDLTFLSVYTAEEEAKNIGINIKVTGSASASRSELVSYSQSIEKGKEVEYGSTVEVYFKTDSGVSELESSDTQENQEEQQD